MSVCIIGSGPAGLYTAKHLLSHNIKTTMYEKLPHPYGLFKCGFSPFSNYSTKIFTPIFSNPNFKLKLNETVTNIKNLQKKYDAFVIATGCGLPREVDVDGREHIEQAIDIIKSHNKCQNKKFNFGENVLIIGCGNVSLDIVKLLFSKNVKNISVLSRSGPFTSAFTNSSLREIYNIPNLNIKLKNSDIYQIEASKNIERRKKIFEIHKMGEKTLEFIFYSKPIKIDQKDSKLDVQILDNDKNYTKSFDFIVSAIGFKSNVSVNIDKIEKPIFQVGWCKNPIGNLNDIKNDAIEISNRIIKFLRQ
ncbi:hypothetical protein GVAV_000502 [Gurleya vavrai]